MYMPLVEHISKMKGTVKIKFHSRIFVSGDIVI